MAGGRGQLRVAVRGAAGARLPRLPRGLWCGRRPAPLRVGAGRPVAGGRGGGAVRRRVHGRVRRDPRRGRVAGRRAGGQRGGAAARRRGRDDRDGAGVRRARSRCCSASAGCTGCPAPGSGARRCSARCSGWAGCRASGPRSRASSPSRRARAAGSLRGVVLTLAYCAGLGLPFVAHRARRSRAVRGAGLAAPAHAGDPDRRRRRCWSRSGCCWSAACGAGWLARAADVGRRLHPGDLYVTTTAPAAPAGRAPGPPRAPGPLLRNAWRGLTSHAHRAGAAVPARPRRAARRAAAAALAEPAPRRPVLRRPPDARPAAGPAQFFDVFAAPWFAAVYLLLMVSLVGCLLPRARRARSAACAAPPVATPRNLARLPHAADGPSPTPIVAVEERARGRLRGWRARWRDEPGPASGPSRPRRGHLREVGQPRVPPRAARPAGGLRGRQALRLRGPGHRPVRRRPVLQHRHPRLRLLPRRPARRRHRSSHPFCVRVDDFTATYVPNGQPAASPRRPSATRRPADLAAGRPPGGRSTLAVNHPLRTRRQRVYLLGHGYAPRFTVTFRTGSSAPARSSGARST